MAKLKITVEEKPYFTGPELTKARESLGLTEAEFAEKCGWSQQYQAHLEHLDSKHNLTFEKREAFKRVGIYVFDSK